MNGCLRGSRFSLVRPTQRVPTHKSLVQSSSDSVMDRMSSGAVWSVGHPCAFRYTVTVVACVKSKKIDLMHLYAFGCSYTRIVQVRGGNQFGLKICTRWLCVYYFKPFVQNNINLLRGLYTTRKLERPWKNMESSSQPSDCNEWRFCDWWFQTFEQ